MHPVRCMQKIRERLVRTVSGTRCNVPCLRQRIRGQTGAMPFVRRRACSSGQTKRCPSRVARQNKAVKRCGQGVAIGKQPSFKEVLPCVLGQQRLRSKKPAPNAERKTSLRQRCAYSVGQNCPPAHSVRRGRRGRWDLQVLPECPAHRVHPVRPKLPAHPESPKLQANSKTPLRDKPRPAQAEAGLCRASDAMAFYAGSCRRG